MAMLTLRFDLRTPPFATTSPAAQYAACLDMCEWADERGFTSAVISEHHGIDDGYLPAPLVLAGAILGRTRRLMVNVAAVLVPLHDPVRLAEQVAVLDLASGGRFSMVAGMGYRPEEFDMAGVDYRSRARLLEEHLDVMRRAWTGEPFEWQGRTCLVTPAPATRPHPPVLVGGSTEQAARRAARLRLPFMPAIGDPALAETYREACAEEGFQEGWVLLPAGPGFVHVTEDPERDWERIAPFALHEATTYAQWQTPGQRSQVHTEATTADELRKSGVYAVVTPDECVEMASAMGPGGNLLFHPLMGGMPPALGWESLELLAAKVLPRLG
ncbi:MAG: LLM class flavin-dependent oxidoreductase [Actinobacteria bacterium]|nr:MAG: LLM class flavin-dependent oxidoreductase [Actinomycetota bacterium]